MTADGLQRKLRESLRREGIRARPDVQSFATQQDAIRYHLANNFDWDKWNALLSDEQHGIVSYTSYWYSRINTALREGQTPAGNIQQMIDGATSGLNKWAAASDVITARIA